MPPLKKKEIKSELNDKKKTYEGFWISSLHLQVLTRLKMRVSLRFIIFLVGMLQKRHCTCFTLEGNFGRWVSDVILGSQGGGISNRNNYSTNMDKIITSTWILVLGVFK